MTRAAPRHWSTSSPCTTPAAASGAIDQSDRLFLSHRFKTEEEALSIANASNVGLAGEGVALS